ncbi:MAG: hypothetical protein REI09_14295 [Candidatus Dactylopiibacterium sp.]|nr:hypothetical protein [Candidatus Dactylopiibacterium sp.]
MKLTLSFRDLLLRVLCLAWLGCALGAAPALAQERVEILSLQHRFADEVLPALRPLVAPGGSLSSLSGKLIVRASPAQIEAVRAALAAIDVPQRSLMISVRQGGQRSVDETRIGADGRVIVDERGVVVRGSAEARAGTRQSDERVLSRVQTVEGGQALIQLGQAVPLPVEQVVRRPDGVVVTRGTQYVTTGSGFVASPRVAGETVTVTISPQDSRIARGGRIEGGGLTTTVSGRLGEWIPLGGVSRQVSHDAQGLLERTTGAQSESSDYWIRVDLLR